MDASLYQAGVIALVTCTTKQLSFWQLLIHKKRFPLQIESLDGILIEKHSFYAFKAKQIKVGDYSCMLLFTSKKNVAIQTTCTEHACFDTCITTHTLCT